MQQDMHQDFIETSSDVITPAAYGGIPNYLYQHNLISRASPGPENRPTLDDIGLSATAQKLAVTAMALLPRDLSNLNVAFSFPDFCRAMGLPVGGDNFDIFMKAVKECMRCVISLEVENAKGEKVWENFTWFTHSSYNKTTGMATMKFSPDLAGFLLAIKWVYARIKLTDIGQLQSRYAIRVLNMAISYMSMKGQQGNSAGCWYFERPLSELRFILGVPRTAYEETKELKRKAIENPIKEINKAGIGLEISSENIKQGRRIIGIRFVCKEVPRSTKANSRSKKKIASPQPPSPPASSAFIQEREQMERLRDLNPAEYEALYRVEYEAMPPLADESFKRMASETIALQNLFDKYGITGQ